MISAFSASNGEVRTLMVLRLVFLSHMIRGYSIPFLRTFSRGTDPFWLASHVRLIMSRIYIEDITWPRGDTKFLLEYCKIFQK